MKRSADYLDYLPEHGPNKRLRRGEMDAEHSIQNARKSSTLPSKRVRLTGSNAFAQQSGLAPPFNPRPMNNTFTSQDEMQIRKKFEDKLVLPDENDSKVEQVSDFILSQAADAISASDEDGCSEALALLFTQFLIIDGFVRQAGGGAKCIQLTTEISKELKKITLDKVNNASRWTGKQYLWMGAAVAASCAAAALVAGTYTEWTASAEALRTAQDASGCLPSHQPLAKMGMRHLQGYAATCLEMKKAIGGLLNPAAPTAMASRMSASRLSTALGRSLSFGETLGRVYTILAIVSAPVVAVATGNKVKSFKENSTLQSNIQTMVEALQAMQPEDEGYSNKKKALAEATEALSLFVQDQCKSICNMYAGHSDDAEKVEDIAVIGLDLKNSSEPVEIDDLNEKIRSIDGILDGLPNNSTEHDEVRMNIHQAITVTARLMMIRGTIG